MLNEKQKKFILKNHKDASVRQIAKSLNISRTDVRNFIKTLEKVPSPGIFSKYKKFFLPLSILVLLTVHFAIRYNTFWLSHLFGDQNQYTALALKLEKLGFDGYNLRGVDIKPTDETQEIFAISLSKDEEGSLMKGLKLAGAGYYDIPFFHKGPAFPIALMLSHRLFNRRDDYLLVRQHLGKQVFEIKPKYFFSSQFYAVIVPLFFSMALMLLTLYLGKMLFSYRVGFYAAFMMAVNPISILTAHKLWADDMVALFVALSAVLFYLAQEKDKLWFSLLAGISCGIAVLAKQSAGAIFPGFIAYSILIKKQFKHLITCGIGLALMAGPWFYKIYSIYGDPLYLPPKPNLLESDITGWFKKLGSRPHPLKLLSIGIPYISPPFVLSYFTLKKFILGLRFWNSEENLKKERDGMMFLCFWILAFLFFLAFYMGGREHRRMLPAYPAIAVLSAYVLDKLRIWIKQISNSNIISELSVVIILIISAFWSVPMGLETVMENGALIMKPF
ncbi:MAG: glycosyltransferase family 39 protein [Candidatus Omnitrophica bacterium]|nr:glycosyltransferase family 39 protein [Candidatus Omnitrophota bacterium]